MNKEELDLLIDKTKKTTKEDKDKHLAMWAGVLFFMIFIVFLWFLNTKRVFSNDKEFDTKSDASNDVSEKLDDAFGELREKMNVLSDNFSDVSKRIKDEVKNKEKNINKEEIEALKEKLEASSTDDNIYEKEQ